MPVRGRGVFRNSNFSPILRFPAYCFLGKFRRNLANKPMLTLKWMIICDFKLNQGFQTDVPSVYEHFTCIIINIIAIFFIQSVIYKLFSRFYAPPYP